MVVWYEAIWRTFKLKLQKCFREVELSSDNIRKCLTFSQEKAVLIFQEKETPKKSYLYVRKRTLQAGKLKKRPLLKYFRYFGKRNFLATRPKDKKFLYFTKKSFIIGKITISGPSSITNNQH